MLIELFYSIKMYIFQREFLEALMISLNKFILCKYAKKCIMVETFPFKLTNDGVRKYR